jgi:hypothetical protein
MSEQQLPPWVTPPAVGQSEFERIQRRQQRRLRSLEANTGWIALTPLSTGWTIFSAAYQQPAIMRRGDEVFWKGVLLHGTTGTATILAAGVIPAGMRPPRAYNPVGRYFNGALGVGGGLYVDNTGTLTTDHLVNNSTYDLGSIHYFTSE